MREKMDISAKRVSYFFERFG